MKKADSNHPVKLPGRPVGTGVKYPDHVQKDRHHHSMGSPSMQVP